LVDLNNRRDSDWLEGGTGTCCDLGRTKLRLNSFLAGIFLKTVLPNYGEGGEIKQCCHTFYLKKRFWDAICFTHTLVDFK
jgi:hypothetical protein